MSSGVGATLGNQLLDLVLGQTSYSPATTVYGALYLVAPDRNGVGGVEVSGAGYTRVAIANNTTNWPAAVPDGKLNGTVIQWPGAVDYWGTAVAVALHAAPTGSMPMFYGSLEVARAITPGDIPQFAPGFLKIRFE